MTTDHESHWTGGQYSVFRALFGLYLLVHFARLLPWSTELFSNAGVLADAGVSPLLNLFPNVLALNDSPGVVTAVLLVAMFASLAFAFGCRDRIAAVVVLYVWACLFGRNPLIGNPSIPFVGWLLLAHLFLPRAPFGSLDARGRIDPDGGWRMPQPIHRVAWIVMAVGYTYSGLWKLQSPSWTDGDALRRVLENPLARPNVVQEALLACPDGMLVALTWGALWFEVLFAPLALLRRLRPWLWLGMVAMHVCLLLVIDFADLTLGMMLLHVFTFDPRWVRSFGLEEPITLHYDGACGLCHRAVRFVLAEDRTGAVCRFEPLQSESLHGLVGDPASLPDSIAVRRADDSLLFRSAATLFVLRRLGGGWRVLGETLRVVPRPLLDVGYRFVAAIRRRIFAEPTDVCPLLPERLRSRFVA